jgi:hypothetical protein
MKRTPFDHRAKDRKSIAISIGIHVVAIALIASITFRYPLSAFFSPDRDHGPTERIHYVTVMPAPRASGGGARDKKPPKKATPSPRLLPPATIPTALPPIPPATSTTGADSGTGTGMGGATGVASGLEPAMPDPRIELHPNNLHLPLSQAQRNDSAVKAIFMAYREAEMAAEANRGRSPRDWTMDHNGKKYGLDSQYIYLGKFKLPSAILAALPLNFNGVDGARIIQERNASWIQNDIYMHAQGLSEDDFKAAVKRIRARKDRERKEAQDAQQKAKNAAAGVVP